MGRRVIDLTGKQFGRLVVTSRYTVEYASSVGLSTEQLIHHNPYPRPAFSPLAGDVLTLLRARGFLSLGGSNLCPKPRSGPSPGRTPIVSPV